MCFYCLTNAYRNWENHLLAAIRQPTHGMIGVNVILLWHVAYLLASSSTCGHSFHQEKCIINQVEERLIYTWCLAITPNHSMNLGWGHWANPKLSDWFWLCGLIYKYIYIYVYIYIHIHTHIHIIYICAHSAQDIVFFVFPGWTPLT